MSRAGVRLVAVGLVLSGSAVSSQTPAAPASRTAVISGVVVSAGEPSQPIRKAVIKLSGQGELNRGAVSDDSGRFTIDGLPAGTFTLTISKPAYITAAYGAKRAGQAGTSIVLQDGQRLTDLRVPLTRGSVITGTVRDQSGEPARNVPVLAIRTDGPPATSSILTLLARPDTALTDDNGAYRIYGLVAGTYVVAATLSNSSTTDQAAMLTRAQVDAELRSLQQRSTGTPPPASTGVEPAVRRFSYSPVFHPSATSQEQAQKVTVGPGEERRGVDVSLVLVPVVAVEGVVLGADGQPASAVTVELTRPGPQLPLGNGLDPILSKRPAADGTFRFTNVAPGAYTLSARSTAQVIRTSPTGQVLSSTGNPRDIPDGPFYYAQTRVDVNGADVSGAVLQMRLGPRMTGRVVFDATTRTPPANMVGVRISLTPAEADQSLLRTMLLGTGAANATPATDGAFEVRGLMPGPYVPAVDIPGGLGPRTWWLRSMMAGGRDLFDQPLTVGENDISDVVLTISDRHTELSGTLETSAGKPGTEYAVVAFPEDRALWSSVRRAQAARPATNGQFSLVDLPPGNYLVATVADLPEVWRTTEFFGTIAAAGVKVTIGEGEKKVQVLRIAR